MFLIDCAHQRCCWRQYFVDEYEDSLLWGQLDPFPNDIHELTNGQILKNREVSDINAFLQGPLKDTHGRHEVLLLVDCRDICAIRLLADNLWVNKTVSASCGIRDRATNRNSIWVLLPDALSLCLALL